MSRRQKTADDLVQSNEEYVKLKGDQRERGTPREAPRRRSPEGRGYEKPDYSRWTVEELKDLATRLGIENVDERSHTELTQILTEHDATEAREGGY